MGAGIFVSNSFSGEEVCSDVAPGTLVSGSTESLLFAPLFALTPIVDSQERISVDAKNTDVNDLTITDS